MENDKDFYKRIAKQAKSIPGHQKPICIYVERTDRTPDRPWHWIAYFAGGDTREAWEPTALEARTEAWAQERYVPTEEQLTQGWKYSCD